MEKKEFPEKNMQPQKTVEMGLEDFTTEDLKPRKHDRDGNPLVSVFWATNDSPSLFQGDPINEIDPLSIEVSCDEGLKWE